MSTPYEKEQAAARLRLLADRIATMLDAVPGWSQQAWQCPAADSFEAEAAAEAARLGGVATTLRGIATSLETAATVQRIAETAAAQSW